MRSNLPLLKRIARQVAPLLDELVFVGGATTELFFTAPAATRVRITRDTDVIAEVTGSVEYHCLGERLRGLGFQEDMSPGAPLCRWRSEVGILDVMPTNDEILGFGNVWYERGVRTAWVTDLTEDLSIRVVSPPMFVATKLAAFEGRGESDLLGSHDIEDVIGVVAFRDELVSELRSEPHDVRAWISERIRNHFMEHADGEYAVAGGLPGATIVPALVPRTLRRLAELASL